MKIAICDDDALFRAQLEAETACYADKNAHLSISTSSFSNAEDLMEAAARIGGFDIYLLDIVMPCMNGVDLGVSLRKSGYDGRIIYLSSSSEFALDAYRAKAFNYLLKPLSSEDIFAALDEAAASISIRKEKSLIVRTNESSVKLTYDSILYAQLNRRMIHYQLSDGRTVDSILIRTTFSEAVQNLLRDPRFVLCGASIVANLHHITMVERDALLFRNNFKLLYTQNIMQRCALRMARLLV